MIRFENIDILYALFIVPALVLLFLIIIRARKKSLLRYGDIDLLKKLMPNRSLRRVYIKFVVVTLAFVFIILGLANPQIGSKLNEVKRNGVEVIIALDVSNSMMAEDIKPNRLESAKRAISNLVDIFENDKIGLIVFAGDAFVQLPITSDYASAKMFLETINPDIVTVQGTAIGKAIELAEHSYSPDNDKNKALIIITDGENHEDDALIAAEEANKKGIIVNTIGMGLPKGAPIPVKGKFGRQDYRVDNQGNIVVSKLNEDMLSKIATAGGGTYIRATNYSSGLQPIFDSIEEMEKSEFETQVYADYEDRFQYFIAIALFLLIFDFLVLERKNKFLQNLNLFKVDK